MGQKVFDRADIVRDFRLSVNQDLGRHRDIHASDLDR
jgi:hypothetical protein